ncbi:hypothetical protein D3C80_1801570 [compost metagenome]
MASTIARPLTGISNFFIPINENTKVAPGFTLISYLPLKSVVTVFFVDFSVTFTPGRRPDTLSVTAPVTVT